MVAMRAPVLSATSSLERICTIELLRHHLDQTPALQLTQWPRLHDADGVAVLGFVFLIVRIKLLLLLHDLTELAMRHPSHAANNDGFIHSAGNHLAHARLARTTRVGNRCYGLGRFSHNLFFSVLLIFAGGKHRLDPSDVPAQQTQPARLLKLAALLLQS